MKDALLTKELSDSIELDKLLVTENFDLQFSNQYFKLLRWQGFNSTTPFVMYYNKLQLHSDLDKGNAFNVFFTACGNKFDIWLVEWTM